MKTKLDLIREYPELTKEIAKDWLIPAHIPDGVFPEYWASYVAGLTPKEPEAVVTAFTNGSKMFELDSATSEYVKNEPNGSSYSFANLMHQGFCVDEGTIKIHSIKVGDTEYSIGEDVLLGNFGNTVFTIEKFEYEKSADKYTYFVRVNNKHLGDKRGPVTALTGKPLFTTEDGKEIFEGDFYSPVGPIMEAHGLFAAKRGSKPYGDKQFSTEQAALTYIDMNKKQFSKQDILNASSPHGMRINNEDVFLIIDKEKLGI